jgi:hypothetical protein
MIGKPDPLSEEVAGLLRYERELEPTAAEVRRRVLARAQFSQRLAVVPARRAVKSSYVVAGAFTVAFSAAAFTAIRSRSPEGQELGATSNSAISNTAAISTTKKLPADVGSAPDTTDVARNPAANVAAPIRSEVDGKARSKVSEANTKTSENTNDTLTRELVLLKRARAAISSGSPASALPAIGEHAQQFPNGRLREEREALRVTALWNMGKRADARRAAARFVQQFPRSVLAAQMATKAETRP